MTATEMKELMSTTEGKAKMAAIINARGKDALRQMCMELVVVVLALSAEVETLREEKEGDE